MVALSGSIAHLNLETGGDLDMFLVTRGARVWSTAVMVVVVAKLLHRRATLCANFVVAESALAFDQQDLFTASQVDQPRGRSSATRPTAASCGAIRSCGTSIRTSTRRAQAAFGSVSRAILRAVKSAAEFVLFVPSLLAERVVSQRVSRVPAAACGDMGVARTGRPRRHHPQTPHEESPQRDPEPFRRLGRRGAAVTDRGRT